MQSILPHRRVHLSVSSARFCVSDVQQLMFKRRHSRSRRQITAKFLRTKASTTQPITSGSCNPYQYGPSSFSLAELHTERRQLHH